MPLTPDDLARIVHHAISVSPPLGPVEAADIDVRPWDRLTTKQRDYCRAIGEAVVRAVLDEAERPSVAVAVAQDLQPGDMVCFGADGKAYSWSLGDSGSGRRGYAARVIARGETVPFDLKTGRLG